MSFYNDVERIRTMNRALSDRAFFYSIGYDYDSIPYKLRELSLPVASPHQHIKKKYEGILDIGCGVGTDIYLLSKRPGSTIICGIDVSYPLLKEGKKIHNLNVLTGEACFLPFKNNSFELIIMNGTFNLIENKTALLYELKRVTKTPGNLIVSDIFKKKNLFFVDDGVAFNISGAFSKDNLLSFFESNGFKFLEGVFNENFTEEFGVFSSLWKVL